MAKFYGTMVKTGKIGGSVFTVLKGTTIEKQYQPIVSNPSSAGQVAQRTKFKLMSQLAAALQPEIAFRREGMQSPRNLFVKDMFNRDAVTYADGVARVIPANIRLTAGRITPFTQFAVTRQATVTTVNLTVSSEYREKIMGIRVVSLKARGEGVETDVIPLGKTILPDPTTGLAETTFSSNENEGLAIYVYAFWPASEEAITKYGNIVATVGDIALSLERMRREIPTSMEFSATYYGFGAVS